MLFYYSRNPLTTTVTINGTRFTAEVAATAKEKELGLGQRASLKPLHGMLFPFDHVEQFTFWMKGMQFPIDVIWIRDNTVVDISKNVPVTLPDGRMPSMAPKMPINKVFEVNAGEAEKYNINIGDVVIIKT